MKSLELSLSRHPSRQNIRDYSCFSDQIWRIWCSDGRGLVTRKWRIPFLTLSFSDSVDKLMAESHELAGSAIAVDRATPKVRLFPMVGIWHRVRRVWRCKDLQRCQCNAFLFAPQQVRNCGLYDLLFCELIILVVSRDIWQEITNKN